MTPEIEERRDFRTEVIDYDAVITQYPWIVERGHKCVISPDADGILCGLFMSEYLDWEIVGYYDNGKNLILKKGIAAETCVFLDTEIYRSNIRSVGQHISLFRKENTLIDLEKYRNCLNPNSLRGRTLKENFSLKYPLGTIHLLLCIVGNRQSIHFADNSFFVILQADGTINRFLDRYSENLYDWLLFLDVENPKNVLRSIIRKEVNLMDLNKEYVEYIQRFVKTKRDKIPISERGEIIHESFDRLHTAFSESCTNTAIQYLEFLSRETGWKFNDKKWAFNDFRLYQFIKKAVRPGVRTFNVAVEENFLSLAITATDTMEYTLESPDLLP
jgi:hypothetical protein